MSHNINTYIGRQAAWHTLGTVTGKYMTTDELLRDPGFQYVVFKSQLRDGLGRPVDAYGTFRWNHVDKIAGRKEAATFLGTVGKDYAVMQHDEGFKSIDAVMNTVNGAHYETAGVLGNGERVWAWTCFLTHASDIPSKSAACLVLSVSVERLLDMIVMSPCTASYRLFLGNNNG